MSRSNQVTLHCSFCGKSQDIVGKLISSPSDYPRAYICDECVQKYTPEEQQYLLSGPVAVPNRPSHCLMCHPEALQLLADGGVFGKLVLEPGDERLREEH